MTQDQKQLKKEQMMVIFETLLNNEKTEGKKQGAMMKRSAISTAIFGDHPEISPDSQEKYKELLAEQNRIKQEQYVLMSELLRILCNVEYIREWVAEPSKIKFYGITATGRQAYEAFKNPKPKEEPLKPF